MPLYHLALIKFKPGVTAEQIKEWDALMKEMVGKIPGLISLEVNSPLASTAHRSQGFHRGMVSILEKTEDLNGYIAHPSHLRVKEFGEKLCEEMIVYDLEF
ncbi:hypothetical protein F4821DRAFT_248352 [Hypoxylon rubiginosum]|uniref:Uncharacterized protein n=1 Tax=Hypoxylon rubiginosum TaxID=110542 RepID=A0ACC0CN84_9PEZI|nr:hypothetical protein F4821DRAFT_248352 [Hypoxylon rubiginosum]